MKFAPELRILIIEPTPLVVDHVMKRLSTSDCRLKSTIMNSLASLNGALSRQPWDLIISNLALPDGDGRDVMRICNLRECQAPVIFIGLRPKNDLAADVLMDGARDCLYFPQLDRLKIEIQSICEATRQPHLNGERHSPMAIQANLYKRLFQFSETAVFGAEGRDLFLSLRSLRRKHGPGLADRLQSHPDICLQLARQVIIFDLNPKALSLFEAEQPNQLYGSWDRALRAGSLKLWTDVLSQMAARSTAFQVEGEWETLRGNLRNVIFQVGLAADPSDRDKMTFSLLDVTPRIQLQLQLQGAQRMEAIGRLAGGLAHDFNNLLTVIIGSTHFLIDRLPANTPNHQDARTILNAAHQSALIIDQLLAFSRQKVQHPREVMINDSIKGLEKIIRRLMGEGVQVELELQPDLGLIRIEPSQFEQILMNLSINSRDAMPQGGMLKLKTANLSVREDLPMEKKYSIPAGRYVVFSVMDNGIGMTETVRQRVFEPFFTTKSKAIGTGLGLSTVYGIVKQNGGFIHAESEPRLGAVFSLYFPALKPEAVKLQPLPPEFADGAGHETVMVTEDSDLVRQTAVRILEGAGYKVLEMPTPARSIEVAQRRERPVDLLLTDVVMPLMNGFDLADRILHLSPKTKVLYMSGYSEQAQEKQDRITEDNFLNKPFSPRELLAKVRGLLDSN